MNLNEYAQEVHAANEKWWRCLECGDDGNYVGERLSKDSNRLSVIRCPFCQGTKRLNRNVGEMLALVHSEISEALEGHRKGLMDDKLPHRKMFEVELADALIRIFDIGAGLGLDLEGAYKEKMVYNAVRADHKIKNRMKEGGKKY